MEQSPPQHHRLQLIRKRELAKLLTVDPWTIDIWRKRPKMKFPNPIVLSDQVLVWRLSDFDLWLQTMEVTNANWRSRMSVGNPRAQ